MRVMKYKLTDESKRVGRATLFRIEAVRSFNDVAAGDKGGWIEAESNLCQAGDAWVYGDATVYGNARVYGNAWVYGDARVSGDAQVYGNYHWTTSPLQIQGSRHYVNVDRDGPVTYIHIGCIRRPVNEWVEHFESIGCSEGYTAEQIAEYGRYINLIAAMEGNQ